MSLEETDARLRRRYLIFIAEKLGERDRLLDELTERLSQITGADISEEDHALLEKMREIDSLLMQSRFCRALSNATWVDHMITNLIGYAKSRPISFALSILNFSVIGVFSYFVASGRVLPGLAQAVAFVSTAEAASFDMSNPDHIKIIVFLGIAIVLCVAFLFFAGAACLSPNGDTRKRCWEFVRHTSTFMLGIIAGYFGRSL